MNEIDKGYFMYLLEKDMRSTFKHLKLSLNKIIESDDWYQNHDTRKIFEVMDRTSRKIESIKKHIDQLDEMEELGLINKLSAQDIIDKINSKDI